MVTVQHIVYQELSKNPFLTEVLALGLANVSAVANFIHPTVQQEFKKPVKYSAVGMAIRRYMDNIPYRSIFKFKFPKDLEISTMSDIYEIAIERTPFSDRTMFSLRKMLSKRKGNFLSIIEGTYEIAFYTNQKNRLLLRKILRRYKTTSERENLSFVSVNFSQDTKEIPGIYYHITRSLAYKGLSIQSFHTIGSEMTIFVKSEILVETLKTIIQLLRK